jgi:DNA primase large subunit
MNILEKYYQGKTSLEEENLLRSILLSEEISKENYDTHLLFQTFEEEKKETAPASLKTLSFFPQKSSKISFYNKRWIQIAGAAAACFVIALFIFFSNKTPQYEAYVIINGVRIDDKKLALQYIKESYAEEERITQLGLAQLVEMEKIENKLNEIANNISNHH